MGIKDGRRNGRVRKDGRGEEQRKGGKETPTKVSKSRRLLLTEAKVGSSTKHLTYTVSVCDL